jgi:DNA-directed RNA polymerase subunit RPC12/RpoP
VTESKASSPRKFVSCPGCGERLGVRPEDAGRQARCAKCGHVFGIGAAGHAGDAPPAAAPAAAPVVPEEPLPALVSFECSLCQTRITAMTVDVGRKVACPDCGRKNVIPPPPKAKKAVTPAAMEGEQYELWGVDEAPMGKVATRELYAFDCRVCQTMMYATQKQLGLYMTCPDCGARTIAKPHKTPAKPKGSFLVPAGQEYQLDELAPPEPRPFAMPIAIRDAELHRSARATTVGPDGRLIVQVKEERDRRQARPAVPLVQGAWRMLATEEVIARGIFISIVFGVAAWLFNDSVNTPVAGVAAIASMGLMVAFVGASVLWLSFAAPFFLAIIAESSEGHDRLHEPPVWSPLDWFMEGFYFLAASFAAGLPALGVWKLTAELPPETQTPLIAAVVLLIFPLALLGALLEDTPFGVVSPKLLGTLPRCAGPWLLFYVETTAMWALAALAAWGLMRAGDWGVLPLPFIAMGALITYMRLLGRLGWWIGDVLPAAEPKPDVNRV